LRSGAVDIGLIPSIEFQTIPGSKIIPGPAIACRHRVRSVLLVSVAPLWDVRRVACDQGSRTSIALARIIFEDFYHVRPEFQLAPPDLAAMLSQNDAALIIGDAALKFIEEHERPDAEKQKPFLKAGPEPLYVFDLMERWKVLTGLPFVFAFWAVRKGFKDKHVVEALKESRDYGLQNIGAIAAQYSERLSVKKEFVEEYLRDNVYYHMDSACLEGLRHFYDRAARVGVIKSERPLEFL